MYELEEPFKETFSKYIQDIDTTLRDRVINKRYPLVLKDALMSNSNRFRPLLIFLGYNLYENKPSYDRQLVSLAAGIECLHKASVIIDDVIDQDPLRRGHPAFHTLYNSEIATLTGAYLVSASNRLINEAVSLRPSKQARDMIIPIYYSTIDTLFIGAFDEQFKWPYSILSSARISRNMTASLIRGSIATGCYLNNTIDLINVLPVYNLGCEIGLIFQYINDLRQFSNAVDEDISKGKIYTDLKGKRNNIVLGILYSSFTEEEKIEYRDKISSVKQNNCKDSLDWILAKINEKGAIKKLKSHVNKRQKIILDKISIFHATPSVLVIRKAVENIESDLFWDKKAKWNFFKEY